MSLVRTEAATRREKARVKGGMQGGGEGGRAMA
jgi:hypothetical protein